MAAVLEVPGVRSIDLREPEDRPYFFVAHVEGGDVTTVWQAINRTRGVGIAFSIVHDPAPWWWRLWCWIRGVGQ